MFVGQSNIPPRLGLELSASHEQVRFAEHACTLEALRGTGTLDCGCGDAARRFAKHIADWLCNTTPTKILDCNKSKHSKSFRRCLLALVACFFFLDSE